MNQAVKDWTIDSLTMPSDLDAVLRIEQASFVNPWTREMYLAELENHGVSYCYVVRGPSQQVIGFCSFWRVLDELHIESVGAMVNTELMVKLGRSGKAVVELGVTHYPRTGGRARGAHPRVIARAVIELVRMYRRLDRVGAGHASPSEPAR